MRVCVCVCVVLIWNPCQAAESMGMKRLRGKALLTDGLEMPRPGNSFWHGFPMSFLGSDLLD